MAVGASARSGKRRPRGAVFLCRALAALLVSGSAALAQEISIDKLEQYTENRGWNEAGNSPTYQIIVTATVAPSGLPTLVYAEQNGVREPLTHYALPAAPDLYIHWRRFDPASTGPWRIVAERGAARGKPALTPAVANPQKVPLARDVRATGKGTEPRVSWRLPSLKGFDIDRIRVSVRGGKRIQGRFLSVLYVSPDLPPGATAFRIPSGLLTQGEPYVFQVTLDDLEGELLENRSSAYSKPYTATK